MNVHDKTDITNVKEISKNGRTFYPPEPCAAMTNRIKKISSSSGEWANQQPSKEKKPKLMTITRKKKIRASLIDIAGFLVQRRGLGVGVSSMVAGSGTMLTIIGVLSGLKRGDLLSQLGETGVVLLLQLGTDLVQSHERARSVDVIFRLFSWL